MMVPTKFKVAFFMVFQLLAMLPVQAAGMLPAAEFGSDMAGWKHFNLKPGQYFKYEMNSARGLKGWVSVKAEVGADDSLKVTLAGKWGMGEFAETGILKQNISGFDFLYSMKNFEIPNAMNGILAISGIPFDKVKWRDGFSWSGNKSKVMIQGHGRYAGVSGLNVIYISKHFATGKMLKKIYCINPKVPLPLYLETPAARDTWVYKLVEYRGIKPSE